MGWNRAGSSDAPPGALREERRTVDPQKQLPHAVLYDVRGRTAIMGPMLDLNAVVEGLEALYGPPPAPTPRTALDWVLWENAAYLVSDEQRREA